MTPRTPTSASMSAGAPPVTTLAATGASTKTWLPVPISRLSVRLPVLATKTYLPSRVIQQDAACPAATTDANAPLRKSASWFECASVMSAVPSPSGANPNGASEPVGADTAAGAVSVTRAASRDTTSTVPGSGSALSVISSCAARRPRRLARCCRPAAAAARESEVGCPIEPVDGSAVHHERIDRRRARDVQMLIGKIDADRRTARRDEPIEFSARHRRAGRAQPYSIRC